MFDIINFDEDDDKPSINPADEEFENYVVVVTAIGRWAEAAEERFWDEVNHYDQHVIECDIHHRSKEIDPLEMGSYVGAQLGGVVGLVWVPLYGIRYSNNIINIIEIIFGVFSGIGGGILGAYVGFHVGVFFFSPICWIISERRRSKRPFFHVNRWRQRPAIW